MCNNSGFEDRIRDQRRSAHTREGFRANARPRRGNPGGLLDPGMNLAQNVAAAAGAGNDDFAVDTNREAASESAAATATATAAAQAEDLRARGVTAQAERARRRRLRQASLLASGGMGGTDTLGA